MPGSDLYLDRNTFSLTALALSQSVLSHFIRMSALFSEKWWMLVLCSRNTSLVLNCPRIQCRDYMKCNAETNTMAASHKTQNVETCATKNPDLSIFWNGKQRNCKTCLEIFMIRFILIFVWGKFKHTKYAQIVWVNRSVRVMPGPHWDWCCHL